MFAFAGFPGRSVLWPDRAVWGRERTAEVKGRGRVPKKTEGNAEDRHHVESDECKAAQKRRQGDRGERRGVNMAKNNGDQERGAQRKAGGKREPER